MTTTTTEAFETGLRAEFEAWAKERGHPLCDVIPKYGPASSMSDTTLRFSDIAWEAYRAAKERAAKQVEALRDDHCKCTKLSTNKSDWCEPNDAACEFVVAWNDAIAAIRASSGKGDCDV